MRAAVAVLLSSVVAGVLAQDPPQGWMVSEVLIDSWILCLIPLQCVHARAGMLRRQGSAVVGFVLSRCPVPSPLCPSVVPVWKACCRHPWPLHPPYCGMEYMYPLAALVFAPPWGSVACPRVAHDPLCCFPSSRPFVWRPLPRPFHALCSCVARPTPWARCPLARSASRVWT
jgi:hypothetical protein